MKWIGCDFDGTIAYYNGDVSKLGAPIKRTVRRVQAKLEEGVEVRIFTARVSGGRQSYQRALFVDEQERLIGDWTEEHVGHRLQVTCEKDFACVEIWDDRARGMIANEGLFHEEAQRVAAGMRLLVAQQREFQGRGYAPPWHCQLMVDLNPYEQEALQEELSKMGLHSQIGQRVGGGHSVSLRPNIVGAGAGALLMVGGRVPGK